MSTPSHVLCIRLSAMGDVAMTVPVLIALTRKYPQLKITILTKPFFAPFFDSISQVEVYTADVKERHKGLSGLYTLFKELKKLKVDAVADMHNVLRAKVIVSLFKLNGTPTSQLDKGRAEKKAITQVNPTHLPQLKTTHERYKQVFKKLGFTFTLSKKDVLPKGDLAASITELVGSSASKWIGIAPFAAHEGKKYPLDLMEQVIADLDAQGFQLMLFGGGKREAAVLNNFASKYTNALNCTGKLTFRDELALISRLDIMLSMDSGNGHLAAMYGVPVVTLWGVTHPCLGFTPFGQPQEHQLTADRALYPLIPTSVYGNSVPEGYDEVMQTISPKTVVNKIVEIIS